VAVPAAVLVTVALLAVTGCGMRRSTGTPGPTGALASTVDTAGLDVLGDNAIHRPDGRRVPLGLPSGGYALDATLIPGGWLVEALEPDARGLWFVAEPGGPPPRRIGTLTGNYAVSGDGRYLVVAGLDGSTVAAYGLPGLRELRRVAYHAGMGPLVPGVGPDWALLSGALSSPGPAPTAVWHLRDGTLRQLSPEIWAWGVSRTGDVLHRVDHPGGACLAVAALADLAGPAPVAAGAAGAVRRGFCAAAARQVIAGSIAPGGQRVALELMDPAGAVGLVLADVDDLRAGRWRPVPLHPAGTLAFWDTGDTAVVRVDGDRYVRCTVAGVCRPLALPAVAVSPELSGPVLVPRAPR
jgi:hypothetical protein